MTQGESRIAMQSMADHFFDGMGQAEKIEMLEAMMGKLTEGLDMKEIMPKMMMGMMSGSGDAGPGKMHDMMSTMKQGGAKQQMPEMMLGTMMPHCIGMMLPAVAPDKRGEVAAAIVSAIVEKGCVGLSADQAQSFRKELHDVLNPSV